MHRRDHVSRNTAASSRRTARLSRRFQKIDVAEPSVEETVEILRGLKIAFRGPPRRQVHGDGAARPRRSCRRVTSTTGTCRTRPSTSSTKPALRSNCCRRASRKKTIGVHDIEDIVAKIARIPPKTVSTTDREALKTLERDLKMVVFGQDEAIEALATAIKMSRSGLGHPEKPDRFLSFSPGPPASARPRSRANSRASWDWNSSASTCRSTWSGTPFRA